MSKYQTANCTMRIVDEDDCTPSINLKREEEHQRELSALASLEATLRQRLDESSRNQLLMKGFDQGGGNYRDGNPENDSYGFQSGDSIYRWREGHHKKPAQDPYFRYGRSPQHSTYVPHQEPIVIFTDKKLRSANRRSFQTLPSYDELRRQLRKLA